MTIFVVTYLVLCDKGCLTSLIKTNKQTNKKQNKTKQTKRSNNQPLKLNIFHFIRLCLRSITVRLMFLIIFKGQSLTFQYSVSLEKKNVFLMS